MPPGDEGFGTFLLEIVCLCGAVEFLGAGSEPLETERTEFYSSLFGRWFEDTRQKSIYSICQLKVKR